MPPGDVEVGVGALHVGEDGRGRDATVVEAEPHMGMSLRRSLMAAS